MKKNNLLSIAAMAILVIFSACKASKSTTKESTSAACPDCFQGTITYDMKVSGSAAEMVKGQMPQSYKISYYNGSSLAVAEGGAGGQGDMLTVNDEKYMLDHGKQVAYKMDNDKPKVTKLDDTAEIMGYTCTKYRVETVDRMGQPQIQTIWATKDLKVSDKKPEGDEQRVEGCPLKIMIPNNMMGIKFTITMEAKDKSKDLPEASRFEIPQKI